MAVIFRRGKTFYKKRHPVTQRGLPANDVTASITEAADTLAAEADFTTSVEAAITEAADTLTATAVAENAASLSVTEADDTLSSEAGPPGGELTVLEDGDTLSCTVDNGGHLFTRSRIFIRDAPRYTQLTRVGL